ncbi:LOW QUALITY PROTEIN: hypothetical protein N5P37_008921 [Trichoderma harzianum]|nr:LOW QUALITY PROTEIN: hypothetical protein N5P37_008921 [Trichoderma harzianum]
MLFGEVAFFIKRRWVCTRYSAIWKWPSIIYTLGRLIKAFRLKFTNYYIPKPVLNYIFLDSSGC